MTEGLFGGAIERREGATIERAPSSVAHALREGSDRAELPGLGDRAAFVTLEAADDDGVEYSAPLAPSLAGRVSQRSKALEALGRAASAIAALHASDGVHGDLGLGADAIRLTDDDRVGVVIPARRLPPGALLAARLRAGAAPSVLAFSAPEVVTGYEASPASDVFSLSAIAHEIITGRPPLGQLDFAEARRGPFSQLAAVIEGGLAASPNARPSAAALAAALTAAAAAARGAEQSEGGSYRAAPAAKAQPRPTSPAQASKEREQASSMSGILLALLSVGGLFVFTGAVWLVSVTWAALDGPGRFILLLALTGGVIGASVVLGKKGYAGSGRALAVLGVELFWADGAYLLDVSTVSGQAGAWSLLALVMTAIAFVLAGVLDSVVFAVLAALHYVVFVSAFGVYVHTGEPTGPATYSLAVALVASAIAFAGHRWRKDGMGLPFAGLASLVMMGSGALGMFLLGEKGHLLFATGWPYAVAGIAALGAFAPSYYGGLAALAAGGILTIAPTTQALVRNDTIAYLFAAVGIGFAVLVAAFTSKRLSRDSSTQAGWVLVGLTSIVVGPSLLFLVRCWDKDGLDALGSENGIYLGLVIAIAAALVGASYAFGRRAKEKSVYRLVEVAGLLMIFGTFTLQSLVRYKDAFYPLSVLSLGAVCLAVGAGTKRATLVLLASVALLLNLSIQYFAKLWDVFPASLLVLVFGLALLGGGVLYERRLKHLLPGLRDWA